MLMAAGTGNSSASISAGGVVTAIGFLISAFNSSQKHYLNPDYAQEEADNYNINLKKELNLPINFE